MAKIKIINVVAGIIINQEGEILATKRKPNRVWGNYWEFPGGKIKRGETAKAALTRELDEELGIKTKIGPLVMSPINYDYSYGQVKLQFYYVKMLSADIKLTAASQFKWLVPAELVEFDWPPANQPLIEYLVNHFLPLKNF
ncbi:8-oxo-dGTP diphosphatase MutT [Liquorilactobacillus nagelii]|uniref:8-oxo-dGTP diphosphatase MutT n=1 Tax=Liquorilactobacillus nagelii TaxID=82688 RepID=UPI0039E9A951